MPTISKDKIGAGPDNPMVEDDDGARCNAIIMYLHSRGDIAKMVELKGNDVVMPIMIGFRRAIRERRDLIGTTPESVADSLWDAIHFELIPEGPLADANFIRRGNKCVFQIGYRGHAKLYMRQGVTDVDARVVYKGDHFKHTIRPQEQVVHEPSPAPNRHKQPITHFYAWGTLPSGKERYCVWTQEQVNEHRDQYSDQYKKAERDQKYNSTWHKYPKQMGMKTVIIALGHLLPKTKVEARSIAMDQDEMDFAAMLENLTDSKKSKAKPNAKGGEAAGERDSKTVDGEVVGKQETTAEDAGDVTAEDVKQWEPDEAAVNRLNTFAVLLGTLEQKTDVRKALTAAKQDAESDQERLELEAAAAAREKAISAKRGAGSRSKGRNRQRELGE